jgi:hypothetical protein
MPFLKQQIQLVNQELLESTLKDARFQPGRFEAIAVDVSRTTATGGTETFPAVMSDNYEAQEITVNDTYPISIYHKLLNKTYSPAATSGNYGNGNPSVICKADIKMVVYGKYTKLKLTTEQLEALITTGFPDLISREKLSPYKLDTMTVNLQSSNLNSAAVFAEEYKGFEPFLAPEDILFSIKYTIESRYRKNCFTICDCID